MGISIWQLLIILLIVVLLFGTKKLRSMGKDLGGAMREFRGAVRDSEGDDEDKDKDKDKDHVRHQEDERIIEGKVEPRENERV